mgnify:CR=1 FL=1
MNDESERAGIDDQERTARIGGKGAGELRHLVDSIARWHDMTRGPLIEMDDDSVIDDGAARRRVFGEPKVAHTELAEIILDDSGYTAMWQNDKTPEAPGRLENLKELIKALEAFENLQGFLEHVALIMDNEQSDSEQKVSIMTLHAAKGLEFDQVFLPGWEDGMFPNQRALDESGAAGLEEERRLAYVGLTRARKRIHISFAANRRVHGMWQSSIPSRFVDELPADQVEVSSETGFQGARYGGYGGASGNTDDWGGSSSFGYGSGQGGRGPGYGRRGGEGRAKAPLLEGKGYVVDRSKPPPFAVGERVFHQKFGMGTVSSVDGDKLQIAFDKAGSKKLVASFVSKP